MYSVAIAVKEAHTCNKYKKQKEKKNENKSTPLRGAWASDVCMYLTSDEPGNPPLSPV